jgi:hypothetical protein
MNVHLGIRPHTVLAGVADIELDLTHRGHLMNRVDTAVMVTMMMMMTKIEFGLDIYGCM